MRQQIHPAAGQAITRTRAQQIVGAGQVGRDVGHDMIATPDEGGMGREQPRRHGQQSLDPAERPFGIALILEHEAPPGNESGGPGKGGGQTAINATWRIGDQAVAVPPDAFANGLIGPQPDRRNVRFPE
jgi:hypothetical protein